MKAILQSMKEQILQAGAILVVGFMFLIPSCYMVSKNTAVCYPIEIWIEGCKVLDFFLPFIVSVPFAIPLYMKEKNAFIEYVSVRTNRDKYVQSQIISGMILCAVSVFAVYFIAMLISFVWIYKGSESDDAYLLSYLFGRFQVENPFAFGLIWCLWKGCVSSIFTWFGCRLAICADNFFAISVTPFLYSIADNLITGMLGIEKYSVVTCYILNRLDPSAMHIWNYGAGVFSFCIVTTIVILALKWKKGMIYEEFFADKVWCLEKKQ